MSIHHPEHGEPFGCRDTAPSELYTDWQLSRAADFVRAARALEETLNPCREDVGLYDRAVRVLPSDMRFAMTWCRWSYEAADRPRTKGDEP